MVVGGLNESIVFGNVSYDVVFGGLNCCGVDWCKLESGVQWLSLIHI